MSKILIVEDEVAIAELEKDYLELSGFEVEVENDGMTGLARALAEEFDLFILDLMLPGIDGFEICKQIREKKNTPILMVSAKKEDKNEAILFARNYMKEHLSEPLTRDEVAANVYLSPSYFGHLFKKQMGIGYNEYLSELRVTKAKQLLKSNMAISDVAVAVGFHDAKYFSDIFLI